MQLSRPFRWRPLYDLMIHAVLQSHVIHTDDTPMPVLDPSLPHTRTARLWVYVGDWRHPFTVYEYTTSRKRDGPQQFLAKKQKNRGVRERPGFW